MTELQKVWQRFWTTIDNDDANDIAGYIWQKPNGTWVMLAGDPSMPGRVCILGVYFNPFTGEKLSEEEGDIKR